MKSAQELKDNGLIAVVGAGPGGAMLARLLQVHGFAVKIFERDASALGRPQGGSLDLRPDSGQLAIGAAGLTDVFSRSSTEEAKAFRMFDAQGDELREMGEETHEDAGPEIDRADLRQLLLNALRPETVAWDHFVYDVHLEVDGRWRLEIQDRAPVVADLVVGADGIGSKVRHRLTTVRPHYAGVTMIAANIQKELWRDSDIDRILGEGSVMFAGDQKTVLVQRCNHELVLLYYSMRVPADWPKIADFGLDDKVAVMDAVNEAYREWSPELMKMLTQVQDEFRLWPCNVMPPDYRWDSRPGLTMIGDASHVMPPFTGKGVNLAMLDAFELAHALTDGSVPDITVAIEEFEARMQERTSNEIGACLEIGRQMYGIEMDFSTT